MGPIIIFDKSVLESLNPDEAVWLDQFFLTNITPLFFVETLADLEKKSRSERTPENIVSNLAYKTPDLHSKANVHHLTLLKGELSGQGEIDMEYGRPHIGGGKFVELGGQTGALFEESPEEEALRRWREHKFLELERFYAKQWRKKLSNIDLEEIYSHYQTRFAGHPKPKTFEEIKILVDRLINDPNQEQILITGLTSIGVTPKFQQEIITRWHASSRPSIRKFAPYFTHVLSVDLVFLFGIGADLIGRGRPSHKIDIAYLYYLPFCMVFTSNDHLHKSLTPLFLRPNQSFVSGKELKADLGKLDAHYDALPQETKTRGVYFFAHSPPHDTSFLTTRLWDKHMSPSWRDRKTPEPKPNSPIGKGLMEKIKELEKKAKIEGTTQPSRPGESDQMIIRRMVSAKRGKWTRFPPEVMNRRKNADGDWEDALSN
ncbi:MAG: hypothetical protein AAB626_02120 [Patescibacteria group bacterium]